MTNQFSYDAFLSYNHRDSLAAQMIAGRLEEHGLRVWFYREAAPLEVERGLEQSRTLVLCLSKDAFGSDWARLDAATYRFRDPQNSERRLVALRLDDSPLPTWLSNFASFYLYSSDWARQFRLLLEICRPPARSFPAPPHAPIGVTTRLDYAAQVLAYAFDFGANRAFTGSADHTIRIWDLPANHCVRVLSGHTRGVVALGLTADRRYLLSGSQDRTARLWDLGSGTCLHVLGDHRYTVWSVATSADGKRALTGDGEALLRLWDLESGRCLRILEGHTGMIKGVVWTSDQAHALTAGSSDRTVRLWDLSTGECLRVFGDSSAEPRTVASSPDQLRVLTGSQDSALRLWDSQTGLCWRVLEGHTKSVNSVAWSPDLKHTLTGSEDHSIRLWDIERGICLQVFEVHRDGVVQVTWGAEGREAFSGDRLGHIVRHDLSAYVPGVAEPIVANAPEQVQYTNAKVLLVGESGAGKTGLSKRLAQKVWEPSDSTVGAWATQWKLPVASGDDVEREIWLWDFGGQADQRLIHQLYMDETALAILVFDGQREDLFETLGQWDRDLSRSARRPFAKLLVAGRVDAGGLRVSRSRIEAFAQERGYGPFLETSAKADVGCRELERAIFDSIRWEHIPWRSSPALFRRLRDEIMQLKDAGRVLLRLNELREVLRLNLLFTPFTDDELKAVIGLLTGPGVVWELSFGSWILLQPERINAYAQAVIQTIREDPSELGCLAEERVLGGDLTYLSSMERLEADEERFVLLAMHQTLVERGLCLREHTEVGALLIFPSYYRRERPDLVGHPAVLVSYRFSGFLDDLYATLVVRLHHAGPFQQDQLWRYAADFKTLTGRQLGVKLTRRAEGAGELELYFDPSIPLEEKIIFGRYVHEHLKLNGREVVRLRHYVCPHCGTAVGNREVAMRKLEEGKRDILCVECEQRVPLWDALEDLFASTETRRQVRALQEQVAVVLDAESKERALVGEVISTVALAGQIARELVVSDHGIDLEIEFKTDDGEATGEKLYLQLKSGDSYLRERKRDGAEIFRIHDERHARYWMSQRFPVLLVVRSSEGEVRWMEIRDFLKLATENGRRPLRQFAFQGERFDVMSVRRWRSRILGSRAS